MPAIRPTVRPTSAIAVAARGALVVLVLASCAAPASAPAAAPAVKSSASPTITTSSPSPTPSQASALVSSTLAVLRTVDDTLTGYTIALVADDGRVVARAHASSRSNISDGAHLPRISVSRFRVFFLDGPGDVRAIGREGSNQLMTHLPVGANERAVFAISPDESRIAATIIRYGPPTPECLASCGPTTTFRLYVESLVSGGDHHELQLSAPGPGEVLYPIAWRGDALVLAAGTGWIQNPGLVSPYGAFAYVLVDPANGKVLSRLGAGCYPE